MRFKNVKQLSKTFAKVFFIGTLFALSLVSFQNCSKVGFANSADSIANLAFEGKILDTVNLNVKKNQSITFTAGTLNGSHVGALSFGKTAGSLTVNSGNGKFQILDATLGKVIYTPNESYLGPDSVTMYATDPYGHDIAGQINIIVGNNLNSIQPALAVRGMSCITCHSKVSSNIITDYGFGNDWFFDGQHADSFYLDRAGHDQGLATLSMLNNSKIIVPAAVVPQSALTAFSFSTMVTTLADFVKARFSQGGVNTAAQVQEVEELKINIPTAERIFETFEKPTANQVYIPDSQMSPALSGLNFDSNNQVFTISNLVCDGDLYLAAPVVFADANIQSITGCRIYATANVFMTSPVISSAYKDATNFNTQVLSTKSIWLGVGRIIQNSNFCEISNGSPTGWYSTAYTECASSPSANAANPHCDTLSVRAGNILIRDTFSRAYPDNTSLVALLGNSFSGNADGSVAIDRAHIEAALGKSLYDASCGPNGRAVDANRLMLVAPYVNNRYSGEFSGSTIAESALMSLGTFTYKFDPVFTKVSILPMLDNGELISGKGF